ncbi:MAG: hypothetical protein A2315_05930 [Ignavibacteria bacterium RIFOXYB2_FULL_35_12]|nr:MAG: hypothetical protein A2058_14405 [Ignavibacteria bacterium GWA2_36_19]OGU55326.1 MAG: hypothetical protein A2006_03340 [Ignavibacteria bacterium GWC2_35_8]OGU59314.1 MAG: hypothetical protein A2X60_10800 [Ignavibacteria bacterium GWF2_35_20]OGU80469.1 MAG: hypothetical protein A2254_10565 [Ignavibacteria bacterium RIFOXYA2_FULL_35_9]OGU86493.1 MAG: hypothetical protein A3K31_07460 [Ignavibacteria bacterium RIFOXYA12_FULL_35_25]OGU86853.1 MAG: hypothetical protein A2492_03130 [Ignavibac
MKKNHIIALLIIAVVLILDSIAGIEFREMKIQEKIHPTKTLTKESSLSEYCTNLQGKSGDAKIYFFDSGNLGATVLVLGGTHPNETAGFISALVLIENMDIKQGRFIIIPQACSSGFTCTDPMEGTPQSFTIETNSGPRKFRFGSRVSNPLDQWPDPLVYSHYPSGQQLSGFETRNLNRSYPGRSNGSFTETVGFAIMELIRLEKVDVAIDLHEASPEAPIINAIIVHEKCREIGASAVLNLEFEDLQYALEISPKKFRGLSHREWGDATDVYPFLMETSNPIQGRLRGKTNSILITDGLDDQYERAVRTKSFRISYELAGEPLSLRVGRHIQGIKAILDSYNEYSNDKKIVYENIPSYDDLVENGVGSYLR